MIKTDELLLVPRGQQRELGTSEFGGADGRASLLEERDGWN